MTSRVAARTLCVFGFATTLTLLAACSGDGSTPTKTVGRGDTQVDVTAGSVTVATAGYPAELAPADRDAVLSAIGTYITGATLRPLDGRDLGDLSQDFAPASAAALTGPEQDSLVDRDVPRATGPVKVTLTPVNLTALADPRGAIDLIGATIDLTVDAKSKGGPVEIHRTGELMFTRDGEAWKILGFRLAVTRDGTGLAAEPTSTTVSTP